VPRVSVIMAVYNAAPFLREAVASILSQTYGDFELIAVDDSSSDTSLSILEGFDDPRVQIIRHESNKGASISRNEALAAARGEFIAVMDADDVCIPTRLARQVVFLDTHPSAGLVGCGVYDNIDLEGRVLHTSHLPTHNDAIQQGLMRGWCFLHSSIMFRKALYETVGGYTQAFEPVEDHDFALRVLEHCEAHNLGERLVSYRLNPSGLSVKGRRCVETVRSAVIRLAERRRAGHLENREGTISQILELKRAARTSRGLLGAVEKIHRSFDAAGRYYAFGCLELCAGHLETARRCFRWSVQANSFFVKSWIGIGLSLMPPVVERVKVLFRASMRQQKRT
jgi:glycosyltransferase involved in cell wall biosynthesis